MRTQDRGPQDTGQRTQDVGAQDSGPQDPRLGIQDTGLRIRDPVLKAMAGPGILQPRTQDPGINILDPRLLDPQSMI